MVFHQALMLGTGRPKDLRMDIGDPSHWVLPKKKDFHFGCPGCPSSDPWVFQCPASVPGGRPLVQKLGPPRDPRWVKPGEIGH